MKRMMMVAVVAMAGMAWSALAVPMSITYQGVLSEVVDGVVTTMGGTSATLDVKLWSDATGGTALWGRRIPVTLDHGAFNMVISDSVGSQLIDSTLESVIQNAVSELYIGLTVSGASEITPRQRLLSAAYAVAAKSAEKSASNFAVNGNLTVAGSTVLTGATTVNGPFTTTNGYWMNGGATVGKTLLLTASAPLVVNGGATLNTLTVSGVATLNNTLAVSGATTLNNTLAVSGATTLNGATTVNGLFTTSGGYWMNGGATVNHSTLLIETNSVLEVKGTFSSMRRHKMTAASTASSGFTDLAFTDSNTTKTAKQDLILCITCSNTNPALLDYAVFAIYFKEADNSTYIAAQTHIIPGCQASLTVPIPKNQKFFMASSSPFVTAFCGYVTTFGKANGWAEIWQ